MPKQSMVARLREWAAPASLAAFLLVEFYKAAVDSLPVDAVVLTGAFAALVAARRLFLRPVYPTGGTVVLLWLGLLIVPAVVTNIPNEYGLLKLLRVLSFVTLAAAVTPVLLRSDKDAERFVTAAQMIGAGMLVLATGELATALFNPYGRLEAGGVSTIYLGRGFALVALLSVARLATNRSWGRGRTASLILALMCVIAMFATGNRQGPLAFAVGVAALALVVPGVRLWFRGLVIAAAVAVPMVFTVFLEWLPSGAAFRYRAFLEEGLETDSGSVRVDLLNIVLDSPTVIGHGWGSFAELMLRPYGVHILYPHNLLAEVAYEGGYVLAFIVAAILATALVRAWRASWSPRGLVVLVTLIVALLGAMISSDLNDSRLLFAMASVALTLQWRRTPRGRRALVPGRARRRRARRST